MSLLDLQRAVFEDTCAPTLANHVQHDKDQIGGKFCCQICRIWDRIVCILILDAPELGNIKHQKKTGVSTEKKLVKKTVCFQGIMEEGPTIGAWLSCLTFKPSAFTFLSSMTIRRAWTIWNSKKWKIRASDKFRAVSKAKIHGEKVLRSRISALLVDPQFWTSSSSLQSERAANRNSVSLIALESGKSPKTWGFYIWG